MEGNKCSMILWKYNLYFFFLYNFRKLKETNYRILETFLKCNKTNISNLDGKFIFWRSSSPEILHNLPHTRTACVIIKKAMQGAILAALHKQVNYLHTKRSSFPIDRALWKWSRWDHVQQILPLQLSRTHWSFAK